MMYTSFAGFKIPQKYQKLYILYMKASYRIGIQICIIILSRYSTVVKYIVFELRN